MTEGQTRCGLIALAGRPNVGKSTLLNRLVGQKVSIVTPRQQTTRHRISGVKTAGLDQLIYVDTPGLHRRERHRLNHYMNRTAISVLSDVDVVLWVLEAGVWTDGDEHCLECLETVGAPVVAVVNKVDRVRDKRELLPYLDRLGRHRTFAHVVPVSARNGVNLDTLEACIRDMLPVSPWLFPEDQVTDRSERFLAAEVVREKLTLLLAQELPYALTVEVERFQRDGGTIFIDALVWVERPGHKRIVVGRRGEVLKEAGSRARRELEALYGARVFLRLWVKVKGGWQDDERALASLGYGEE